MQRARGQKRKRHELDAVTSRDTAPRQPNHDHRQARGAWNITNDVRNNRIQEEERHREFLAQEARFVLQQKRKASEIRVKEGRARPIDWLVMNLRILDPIHDLINDDASQDDAKYYDPDAVLAKLTVEQISAVRKEIDSFLEVDGKHQVQEYWQTLKIICKDQQRKLEDVAEGRATRNVSEDITRLLAPKSYGDLERLEKQIVEKIDSNAPIDNEYWQHLLDNLSVYKAKAKLKNLRARVLGQQSKDLCVNQSTGPKSPRGQSEAAITSLDSLPRTKVLSPYDQEVAKGVDEDEEVFAAEADVITKTSSSSKEAQRSRKPRYFNRVQMGYDWNKYNQTHYDHENPPPKVVQGYKFHIFYPELIDPSKAPSYKIIREGGRKKGESLAPAGEEDTCIIRFTAGPPYEDVAFRIVDRDWDYSAKNERGFQSTFGDGILTLHFSFKKVYYRK